MPGRIDGVARAVAGRGATGGGGGTPSASKRRAGDESKLDVDAGGLGAIGGPPRVLRRSDAGLDGGRGRVGLLLLRTAGTAEGRGGCGGRGRVLFPPRGGGATGPISMARPTSARGPNGCDSC